MRFDRRDGVSHRAMMGMMARPHLFFDRFDGETQGRKGEPSANETGQDAGQRRFKPRDLTDQDPHARRVDAGHGLAYFKQI